MGVNKVQKIFKIINFTKQNNEIVCYATELKNIFDLYSKPIRSSVLYIYCSDMEECDPAIWKLNEIMCKMFYIQNNSVKHTFVPILHTLYTEK